MKKKLAKKEVLKIAAIPGHFSLWRNIISMTRKDPSSAKKRHEETKTS